MSLSKYIYGSPPLFSVFDGIEPGSHPDKNAPSRYKLNGMGTGTYPVKNAEKEGGGSHKCISIKTYGASTKSLRY